MPGCSDGSLNSWKILPAPPAAVKYWRLEENATMRDMILGIGMNNVHYNEGCHILLHFSYSR